MGALALARARAGHRGGRGRADARGPRRLRRRAPKPFGTTEVLVGNWGARAERDGLEGVSNPLANLGNQPVELIEADQPLRVERYGLVPDSGGAGRHRGGLAYVREYTVLAERATLTIRTDRRDHPPTVSTAASPARPSSNVVVSGGEASTSCRRCRWRPASSSRATASPTSRPAAAASATRFERDPAAVLEDVARRQGLDRSGARALRGRHCRRRGRRAGRPPRCGAAGDTA